MRIVIDTNVIISAVFFGGFPRHLIELFFSGKFDAVASPDIIQEYTETYEEIHAEYADRGNPVLFEKLVEKMDIIVPEEEVQICRDPDDDKFISCALEGKCLYIVSGDKDLLSLKSVNDVEIVTVAEFFKRILM